MNKIEASISQVPKVIRRLARLSGTVIFVVMVVLTTGVPPAFASGGTSSLPNTQVAPIAPRSGASLSTWQRYAAEQRSSTQSVDWATALRSPGCKVLSITVGPIQGTPPGVPAGIQLDGATIVGQCKGSSQPSPASSVRTVTSGTPTCPNMASYNGNPVTNGYECTGTLTINGNPNWVGAVYTYQGSTSVSGHEELGTVSSGCSPGTAVVNGGTTNLGPNQYEEPVYLRSASATWTATWWQGSTSPYTSWGTVCGLY